MFEKCVFMFVSAETGADDVCRICHGGCESEPFLRPCLCTGTMGLVHASCLEQWLQVSQRLDCEICRHKFNTKFVYPSIKDVSALIFLPPPRGVNTPPPVER